MEQGQCPHCGDTNLKYETVEHDTGYMWYPFECQGCHFKGRELYSVDFCGYEDEEGNELQRTEVYSYA